MNTTLSNPSHDAGARVMSTTTVPPSERTAYWLDMICAMYVKLDCDQPSNQPLYGDIAFNRLGSIDLTHLRSNVPRVARTDSQIRLGGEDCLLVQVQRQGRCMVQQDGRSAVVEPGDFVLYDSIRPYELLFDHGGHDVFVMRLPRAQLKVHVSNLEELTATTVPGQDAAGHLLISMVATLQADVGRLLPSSALGVSEAITSMVAAGLRGLPNANVVKASSLRTYHLSRIKAYVQDHLRDPELSVHSIAHALQLSPDHLSRLFRTEPVPLSRWIWKQRLDACRRDLADPRWREHGISDVAFSWGFNTAAHFSRSFREEYGMSPREWRHGVLPGACT
ncbi:helix-turn-helix domain-containing protein [Hydrogenophaga sp.]|uniref:AraC-like ligand-binding domain-containing protein n=1 Tax=Hydrogenophaga sp. TaxID=1904254 RepID=UPI00272FDEAE|nr:helix-turn-helix domain-containing protein [Hydrogenophaga sp.]MDP2072805.1 helix-turn-helix domain-containing protein [Hydrogenophaga sp.]MDP3108580.1 helix-turn-helix domain-containing protein [Hydrogenophaga sp.]MDZ4399790.1 helix-turn-helix domain-containing protein [Hydrogenophaga sp.]